ncbi:hypothetical protein SEVIR_7G298901v4 [Setaria viridis]
MVLLELRGEQHTLPQHDKTEASAACDSSGGGDHYARHLRWRAPCVASTVAALPLVWLRWRWLRFPPRNSERKPCGELRRPQHAPVPTLQAAAVPLACARVWTTHGHQYYGELQAAAAAGEIWAAADGKLQLASSGWRLQRGRSRQLRMGSSKRARGAASATGGRRGRGGAPRSGRCPRPVPLLGLLVLDWRKEKFFPFKPPLFPPFSIRHPNYS